MSGVQHYYMSQVSKLKTSLRSYTSYYNLKIVYVDTHSYYLAGEKSFISSETAYYI